MNPAFTLALAVLKRFPWKRVPGYLLAQLLGSFVASALIYLHFNSEILKKDPMLTVNGKNSTAAIFYVPPAFPGRNNWTEFGGEVTASAMVSLLPSTPIT